MIIDGRIFELILPALDFRLRAEMLRAGFVSSLHPDSGKRGVDEQIAGLERVRLLGRRKSGIQSAEREIDFGQSVPRLERSGTCSGGFSEFGESILILATRVVCRRIFDQSLEVIFGHDGGEIGYCVRRAKKRKDGLYGRPVNPSD